MQPKAILVCAALLLAMTASPAAAAPRHEARTGYIVALHPAAAGPSVDRAVARLEARAGFRASTRFAHALRGFATRLTERQRLALLRDPSVAAVVPDRPIELAEQTLPTGVDRVDADSPTSLSGIDGEDEELDVDIAIIDTGIQPDHPDLRVVGGHNCVPNGGTTDPGAWADVASHGTHVAGIAAARDNDVGVVGAAPGARLWAVRVFDGALRSRTSWLLCAIDWVAAQVEPGAAPGSERPRIEVANMSLRGFGDDDGACGTLQGDLQHGAICAAVAKGVTFVAAAGNDALDAAHVVPAAYDEVITVSSLADLDGRPGGAVPDEGCATSRGGDRDDTFARYSNFGPDVDVIAPGSCILSTVPGSRYGLNTGTSMAAPLVAGAAALYRTAHPDDTPAEVRTAVRAAATLDWATATDPDGGADRLLDVGRLTGTPDFAIDVSQLRIVAGPADGSVSAEVEVLRAAGFGGVVELAVSGVPSGATSAFDETSVAADGPDETRLVITLPLTVPSGRSTVTVTGTSGDVVRAATFTLVVDREAPSVTAPALQLVAGGTLASGTVPVRAAWTAFDALTDLDIATVQRSGADGWQTVPGGVLSSTTHRVALGAAHRYRVRASDSAGNRSTWQTSPPVEVVRRESSGGTVRYAGGWRTLERLSASGGSVRASSTAGATATFSFVGSGVAWVAPRGPDLGRVTIRIDGGPARTIDLWAASGRARRLIVTASWPSPGAHEIEIRVEGTASRPRVEVDAFVFVR